MYKENLALNNQHRYAIKPDPTNPPTNSESEALLCGQQ